MDAVNATVTEPAEVVNTSSRGERVVINFETEHGEEAKIWCDPDDDEGRFAASLGKGQQVMLMKGQGKNGEYYTFRDSDTDGYDGPPATASSGGGSGGATDARSADEIARAHCDLISACYKYLDQRFAQLASSGDVMREPSAEQIQKMAVSAAMEATD
jgi:hypothetical protein